MSEPTPADIIHFTRLLSYTQAALSIVVGAVMVSLQIGAFRRHKTPSFLLLTISTASGMLMIICGFVPAFLSFSPISWLSFHLLSFLFFCAQAVVGLLGILKLFRDYRQLATICTRLPKTFPDSPHSSSQPTELGNPSALAPK